MTSETTIGGHVQQALSRPEAIWIVASNAIPVAGALFFGWPALSLMLFYWIENAVIGAFNALKIAVSGIGKPKALAAFTVFLVPFFFFHYGLFCYVHGVFVLAMFAVADPSVSDSFDLVTVVWRRLETDTDLRTGVIALIAVQAAWFLVLWVGAGKWRTVNPLAQMFEPYPRIIVLHFTIFVATIPVLLLGQGWIAVAALAAFKACMELGLTQFSAGFDKIKNLRPDEFPDANG